MMVNSHLSFSSNLVDSLSQLLQDLVNGKPIDKVAPLLATLALSDRRRAHAFGINAETVNSIIDFRIQLFKAIYSDFANLCQKKLKLETALNETLWDLWIPLAIQIADWRKQQMQPLIQGFLGGQGTGKTTLTAVLTLILSHLGYQTISLSLDDLYLTYADRQILQSQDPRLARRGPPGTHDLELGLQVLAQLKQNRSTVNIPRFDKSLWRGAGDRTQSEAVSNAEIILFEGWFVGAHPIDPVLFETAPAPILTAADRAFAQDMNARLQDYLPLWQQIDRLIVLYVPDYRLSKQWRKQAEHQMIAQGKAGMSDGEIDEFVEYFWRSLHPELFITPLVQACDLVIEINSDHSPGSVYRRT